MNPQTQPLEMVASPETVTTDTEVDTLIQSGFSQEEVVSLLYLRQWYQRGGSDRVEVIRYLEFLKLLYIKGKLKS